MLRLNEKNHIGNREVIKKIREIENGSRIAASDTVVEDMKEIFTRTQEEK